MDKVKVLVVEDEWIVSEEVKELLERNGFEVIGQAEDARSAMELLRENPADVALLDINIKGDKDGIELASEIISTYSCAIIFLTAFDDSYFLNRARKIKPAAYIVKPFEERNLKIAIDLAFSNLSEKDEGDTSHFIRDRIFVKENSRFKKIILSNILYAEAVGSYTDVITDSGKTTLTMNLKAFEEKISDSRFIRVHRSFLVQLDKIDGFEGNQIYINTKSIPVSAANRDELLRYLKLI